MYFSSVRQHSYYGVMHCENSEVQIAVFRKEICYGTGNLYEDICVHLQPGVNKNW